MVEQILRLARGRVVRVSAVPSDRAQLVDGISLEWVIVAVLVHFDAVLADFLNSLPVGSHNCLQVLVVAAEAV